jgi:hypothetical protein
VRAYRSRMSDIGTIDSELRLAVLFAVRLEAGHAAAIDRRGGCVAG